ncbi:MAG: hypothetical protein KDA53_08825 [Hyphomonas sp.]|nr:hypothetical protein [Hyphomonas sp.]
MDDFLPQILAAVGGVILGPILTKVMGGSRTGGLLGGIVGGLAAHYGLDAADIHVLGNSAAGATDVMNIVNSLLEGGVGGGVLGLIGGMLMKKRG